ncbi:hypothetical protein phiIBB-PF7Ap41 [Pseudomonas phage phiIBB-PF7A]|uniref:Uncharacterized protein n=1 Tax=Pseudomonas phage phiIBB-PF7A TaxID=942165 RepID=E9KII1_9CAUD|nr:hypothetical protein phiIBB-PF7Ap41 [Pseudomonas phage phiIBB-PF7A]ADV35706.1 hypothetical protein phiIBB-PF7Ap41 [Pseudomonas phage phiIBB-PF7A]
MGHPVPFRVQHIKALQGSLQGSLQEFTINFPYRTSHRLTHRVPPWPLSSTLTASGAPLRGSLRCWAPTDNHQGIPVGGPSMGYLMSYLGAHHEPFKGSCQPSRDH